MGARAHGHMGTRAHSGVRQIAEQSVDRRAAPRGNGRVKASGSHCRQADEPTSRRADEPAFAAHLAPMQLRHHVDPVRVLVKRRVRALRTHPQRRVPHALARVRYPRYEHVPCQRAI